MSSTLPKSKLETDIPPRRAVWSRLRIQDAALYALMLSVAVIVFAFQSYNIGFWSPGHGWTSVHGLALMTHATPETGLVAYSQAFRLDDGSISYRYFDRYPFFLNATLHLLLGITDDLPTEIMLFRHLMNVVFLLLMAMSYKLVRLFVENRLLAFGITVLSFASFHMVRYKDMIHYDQPALLLMLVLVYAIARYKQCIWNKWHVFGVALLAVSIGRGYASFFTLGLWFALEALTTLFGAGDWHAKSLRTRILGVLRHPSLWITVIAVVWAGSWLLYNVATEARMRNLPLFETSVVDSAFRRLPFVGNAVESEEHLHSSDKGLRGWLEFASVQTERLVLWTLPVQLGGEMSWRFVPLETPLTINPLRLAGGVALFVVAVVFAVRARPALRIPAAVLAFGGILWLYFMINLSTKHDYVTMYGLGLTLVVYTALFRWMQRFPVGVAALVIGSVTVFGISNGMARADMLDEIDTARLYTYDFNRIRPTLDGNKNTVYLDYDYHKPGCIIQNDICFALGYYLDDNYLTIFPHVANYVLSPRPYYATKRFVAPGETIELVPRPTAPQNDMAFLMDLSTAQARTAPAVSAPVVRYGDAFTLQSWTLDGDVNARACDTVYIESWWLADSQPDANYNMQIAMVTNDGNALTDANAPLGRVPTRIWETDRFVPDVRPINVPCDTPPGEYPLVMGVYNPDTLAPLPVTGGAGEPLGNQFYLTTLFVE